MKRVWIVDDAIPVHVLQAVGPIPLSFEANAVRYLVEHAPEHWPEPAVLELCRALCVDAFSATFFRSPEEMLRTLSQGVTPPHAVIFDWEYPGSTDQRNRAVLDQMLRCSFVYVQIYTVLGHDAVEPKVADLRDRFPGRLLPTKGKAEVDPVKLRENILQAWSGTIAGEVADRVRSETIAAVERTLIDIGGIPKSALAAMTEGTVENLLHLVLAKVRDEIGGAAFEALDEVLQEDQSSESTEAVRRLLSVWYYHFPIDDRVRRGDLIELGTGGDLGFVVTPVCDLANFPKKTGRRLTWLRTVRFDGEGIKALKDAGIKISEIGGSIIAAYGTAGDTVILLPNVPLKPGSRETVADYAVLCHGWDNRLFDNAPGGSLLYKNITPFSRRCTLADPYASGAIAKIMSVMSSPGTPDLPKGERTRLAGAAGILTKMPAASSTSGSALGATAMQNVAAGASSSTGKKTTPRAAITETAAVPIASEPPDDEEVR